MMIVAGALPLMAALALIPAYIASRKGHSFGLWYLGGLVLWPFALVEALVVRPAGAPASDHRSRVQTWRPFIALVSVLVVALVVIAVVVAANG